MHCYVCVQASQLGVSYAGQQILLGSLSNHDGNAKENVILKMTSKYVKLLRDSFCNQLFQSV